VLKALSIVGYLGMVAGIIGLFATGNLFSPFPFIIAVQIGATGLMFWARSAFGWRSFHVAANTTEGGLVTRGPYKYIRHPIYTGMTVFGVAGSIAHRSWVGGLLGLFIAFCALLRIFCEEVLVKKRYPEYEQYAATTWRMIPYIF
jgi:protein-S-isoprenylcysteine O-methyltransferase Ste14